MNNAAPPAQLRRLALNLGLLAMVLPTYALGQSGTGAWQALTPSQQALLAPFRQQWDQWSANEREVWIRLADKMPGLNAQQQAHAMARVKEWAGLTPGQRTVVRRNFRLARSLNDDARAREWERYRSMTPEQRSVLRSHSRLSPATNNSPLPSSPAHPLSLQPQSR